MRKKYNEIKSQPETFTSFNRHDIETDQRNWELNRAAEVYLRSVRSFAGTSCTKRKQATSFRSLSGAIKLEGCGQIVQVHESQVSLQ